MNIEILNFINSLIAAAPETADKLMTENVMAYLEYLKTGGESHKSPITENGKVILQYMQNATQKVFKAKEIAEGLGTTSRHVTGSIRKLVADNYVAKVGENPIVYTLTNKGKEINITEIEGETEE